MTFTIWVDADSCPKKVKSVILKAAVRYNLPVIYAANRNIPFDFESPLFKMIVCENTEGSADNYIFDHVDTKDLVITRDLPFAKRLYDRKICTINDRGTLFDGRNLERMLRDRELNLQLSAIGVNLGKKFDTYSNKELLAFSQTFDRIINQKLAEK